MAKDSSDLDVGSRVSLTGIIGAALTLAVVVGGIVWYQLLEEDQQRRELVIATGPKSDTYHALGTALATLLEDENVVDRATVVTTAGSVENMQGLAPDGDFDIAFVQGDTPSVPSARLIAVLYSEALHILLSRDAATTVDSIDDLSGLRVAVGPAESGTRQLSRAVLEHFGVQPGENLELPLDEAERGLLEGTLDAALFLTSVPSSRIAALAQSEKIDFVSLGDSQLQGNEADGLALVLPAVRSFLIPRATYRMLPNEPAATVAVQALLVASRDLDIDLVKAITESLLLHRGGIEYLDGEHRVIAQGIREDYAPDRSVIPYHIGAVAHYSREEPPFLVEYAEAISLGLTVLVGLYSGYITLREWARRRKKNRIDAYLVRVEKISRNMADFTLEEMLAHRDALDKLRQRAFSDLVRERLVADESFTIFQNYLRDEFAAVEARIKEKSTEKTVA